MRRVLYTLSLFNENGDMRKSTKSQQAKELESLMTGSNVHVYNNNRKSLVIDGMSLVQTMKGSQNFSLYSAELLARTT